MKKKKRAVDLPWYRLDNAAKLFPAVSDSSNSNVFRLSCELVDEIDPNTLQQALEQTLNDFSSFRVRLRRGVFWYFLEYNPFLPKVHEENTPPCTYFNTQMTKGYLFEVTYFQNRINLEIFHVLADGTGGIDFLRMLVYHYIKLAYDSIPCSIDSPPDCEAPPISRTEDSFSKYYDKEKKNAPFAQRAYRISGTKLYPGHMKIMTATLPVSSVIVLAKQHGVTLTAFLSSLFIFSIYKENMTKRSRKRPIKINIPVNLRNHFPSLTSRNFFSCVEAGFSFQGKEADFETILHEVSKQLKSQLNPQELSKRINYTVATERNFAVRFVPLFLKNALLKIAYNRGEEVFSTALSNLGIIRMPDCLEPYIKGFVFVMSTSSHHPLKCGVCTYRDEMVMTFSSAMAETAVVQRFLRTLTQNGVDVILSTNEVENDEAL